MGIWNRFIARKGNRITDVIRRKRKILTKREYVAAAAFEVLHVLHVPHVGMLPGLERAGIRN